MFIFYPKIDACHKNEKKLPYSTTRADFGVPKEGHRLTKHQEPVSLNNTTKIYS